MAEVTRPADGWSAHAGGVLGFTTSSGARRPGGWWPDGCAAGSEGRRLCGRELVFPWAAGDRRSGAVPGQAPDKPRYGHPAGDGYGLQDRRPYRRRPTTKDDRAVAADQDLYASRAGHPWVRGRWVTGRRSWRDRRRDCGPAARQPGATSPLAHRGRPARPGAAHAGPGWGVGNIGRPLLGG